MTTENTDAAAVIHDLTDRTDGRNLRAEEKDALRRQAHLGKPKDFNPHKLKLKRFNYRATLEYFMSSVRQPVSTFFEVLAGKLERDQAQQEFNPDKDIVDPRLVSLLQEFFGMNHVGQRRVNLDEIVRKHRIAPSEAFGWFSAESFEQNLNISRMMLAVAAPLVVQASIQAALEPKGVEERRMHMTAMGVLPTNNNNRGVVIQQAFSTPFSQNNPPRVAPPDEKPMLPSGPAPRFEETQRNLVERNRRMAVLPPMPDENF